jgi:outer membrane receptor protein involved in Fe transport
MKLPGYVSRERYRALVASPNYGHGFFAQGNVPGGGFAAGVASCASGVPIFGPHDQISADCLKILFVEMNNQADMKQDFVEANVQGRLVKMPAGEARFSAGVHSRENTYQYLFDPLNAESSFLDGPVGNFPADNTEGSTSVDEVYGELLLPLMQGRKGARHLNAELGYRYSDYERQGGVDTYKALLDWGITDTLRFRGGRQLATRAPNIAELFQAQSQTYTTGPTGDPCGLNTNAAYGANPAGNPNAAQARSLCQQLMGSVGAAVFYDPATPRPNGTFGTYWLNTIGNPNVLPEEAKTWTAGFVWQPNTGHALRDGFSSTIDWYQIKIADMIAVENAENVYETCLSVATNPTADINNPACQRIIRNPATGGATATNVTYTNRGNAKVSGVDLSANWRVNLADMGMERMKGYFGINFMLTYLLDLKTQSSRNAPTIDWKGSLGPDPGTSLNNGAYDYRLLTTVSYGFNDWDLNLRWRHLPSAIAAQAAVSRVPVTYLGAQDSYDVFDLAANWSVGEKTTMRMGVDNLLDTPPVVTGGRSALDPNPTTGQGTTEAGFYDILGRQFYVGVQVAF